VYSRDRYKKTDKSKKNITTHRVIKAVDFLEKEGYIVNHIGKAHVEEELRQVSYITPTQAFIDQFCDDVEAVILAEEYYMLAFDTVEVRDDDKNPIILRNTSLVQSIRDTVAKLNRVNNKHKIADGNGENLNNFYCRIFNTDLEHGGRFYKSDVLHMKNKIEKARLDIKIDGEEVVEIDFANLHFRIAAALEGIDMYDFPRDVYSEMLDDRDNMANRLIVKLAVNILFNAKDDKGAQSAIQQEINKLRDPLKSQYSLGKAKYVIDMICAEYPQFEHLFCNNDSYGLRLQNIDSWIAHDVLSEFIKLDKPILPVHDSFIVKREDVTLLGYTMADCFRARLSVDCPVRLTENWKDDGVVYENKIVA
jgi:hypothetical protein